MAHRTWQLIGEASRLSGISVRRLRFYSDEGLLPPAARTESGYRVYSEQDLVRLELIRSLREAGLGLDAIREVLRRELSLADALKKLRLRALGGRNRRAAPRRGGAARRLCDPPSSRSRPEGISDHDHAVSRGAPLALSNVFTTKCRTASASINNGCGR